MEVELVLIPLGLTASLVLGGLFVVSAAAERQSREWQAGKDTYRTARGEIRRRKHTLQTVTVYEWPIWPRPVLYESIDRQTQLAFARAEEALTNIRRIDSQVRPVAAGSPGVAATFRLTHNLSIYQNARSNLGLLAELQAQQHTLADCLQQIGRNQAIVTQLQKQVEADVLRFRQEYTQADAQYLGYLNDASDPHYIEVSTLFNEANACLSAAEAALSRPAAVDGMGHAVAHFWQQAAVVFQSSFDAACLVHTYSDTYILDETQQRMDAILNTLRSMDLPRQSQNWLSMARAYRTIQHQKNAYAYVLRSISAFEVQHQRCLEQKKQLALLNLDELKVQAEIAEAELAEYFVAGQNPEFWKELFNSESAPSQQIQQAQARLNTETEACAQTNIRQSEIEAKITQLERFIQQFRAEMETIGQNVQTVLAFAHQQKAAEAQVLLRLGPNGETTRALQAIEPAVLNSTGEIIQKYQALQAAYHQFQAQAARRQGTNFPTLLAALAAFEGECAALNHEHAAGLAALEAEAVAVNGSIQALRESASALKNKPPQVTGAWEDIFQQFAAVEQQFQAIAGSYERLTAYLEQAPKTMAWLAQEIEKFNQIHSDFAQAKLNLNNHLSSAKKAVDGQIVGLASSWPMPMRDLLNEFKAYKNIYAGLRKSFLRLSNITSMDEALVATDVLEKQIQQVETQVKEKIDLSIKQQKQLNDFEKQIKTIIQNAQYLNISVARVESAREIMEAAREKETFADAYTLLKWAISILQSTDPTTGQPGLGSEHGQGRTNRPGSSRMITSDYKQDVPPENKRD